MYNSYEKPTHCAKPSNQSVRLDTHRETLLGLSFPSTLYLRCVKEHVCNFDSSNTWSTRYNAWMQRRLSDDEDMVVMDMDDYGVVVGSSVRRSAQSFRVDRLWETLSKESTKPGLQLDVLSCLAACSASMLLYSAPAAHRKWALNL